MRAIPFRLLGLSAAFMMAVCVPIAPTVSIAAVDPGTSAPPTNPTGDEIVVIEVDNCTYCSLFRARVLPAYEASERAKTVPIRFMRAQDISDTGMRLRAPVSVAPTVLILRENNELARIPGMTGQDTFFQVLNHVLGRP